MAMATDMPSTFEKSSIKLVGFDMSRAAAVEAYAYGSRVLPLDLKLCLVLLSPVFSCLVIRVPLLTRF
jgi:hypothetical protein